MYSTSAQKNDPDAANWPIVLAIAALAVVVLVLHGARLRRAAISPVTTSTAIQLVSSWSPLS